jgi:hypothetical protein
MKIIATAFVITAIATPALAQDGYSYTRPGAYSQPPAIYTPPNIGLPAVQPPTLVFPNGGGGYQNYNGGVQVYPGGGNYFTGGGGGSYFNGSR